MRCGGSSSAQHGGSFHMLRDQCAFLCSTILSKRTKSIARTVDAAADLANLLSSRKSRSILWQVGGETAGIGSPDDRNVGNDEQAAIEGTTDVDRNGSSSMSNNLESSFRQKLAPVPKIWNYVLQAVAVLSELAATTERNGDGTNCYRTRAKRAKDALNPMTTQRIQ